VRVKTARASVLLLAFVSSACGARTPIVTVPYQAATNGSSPTQGLVYFTPRTLLRLDITYTVTFSKSDHAFQGARIRKPVVVTSEVQPDPANRFLIRAENASSSAFSDSDVSVKLTDSGLLAAVDAEITDKSLEAARAFVGTGISIAKLVTEAKFRAASVEATVDEDLKYSALLDPSQFKAKDGYYEQAIVPAGLVADVKDALLPTAVVRLFAAREVFARAGAYPFKGEVKGIVHRRPEPIYVEVKVPSGDALLLAAAEIVSFDQFGEFLALPVTGKMLSSRKTAVKLGAGGGVTDVSIQSKGSAADVFKQLAGTADDVRGALDDLRFNLKTAELAAAKKLQDAQADSEDAKRLAELKQQKELAEAEADLLKAQKALETAREEARATPTAQPTPRPRATARPKK
jgi:hypothetical protein